MTNPYTFHIENLMVVVYAPTRAEATRIFDDSMRKHDAKARADAFSELLEKMHPCKNCPSYPNECNHTEYFEDCCRTEKTISWEDLRSIAE